MKYARQTQEALDRLDQSLKVLRDLIKSKMIKQIKDEDDTRKKNLFLDSSMKMEKLRKLAELTFKGKFYRKKIELKK